MIRTVYAVKDKKGEFWNPSVDQNDASAIRNFAQMVNTEGTLFAFAPGDFELYQIGLFDTETGKIEPLPFVVCLASGDSLVGAK